MEKFHGKSLAVHVFLEGQEIDVISVSVRGGFNAPAGCTINIPFASTALRFLPRTLVHVFYVENTIVPTAGGKAGVEQRTDDVKNWKLLFAGEVHAFQYADVGSSKQIVLSCQDFSTYWSHVKLYWGTNNHSAYGYKTAIAAGASQLYSGSKRVDGTDRLLNLLKAKPASIPTLAGILGGLVALLESATGVFHPLAAKRFRGVNDFMSQAELRLKLTHMLGATGMDTTSVKFIDSQVFTQYIRRLARSIGHTASFMDLVGLFLNRIYYSWASVPAPPYFPFQDSGYATKIAVVRKATSPIDPKLKADYKILDDLHLAVQKRRTEEPRKRRDKGDIQPDADGTRWVRHAGDEIQDERVPDLEGHKNFVDTAEPFKNMADRWSSGSLAADNVRKQMEKAGGGTWEKYVSALSATQELVAAAATLERKINTPYPNNQSDPYQDHNDGNLLDLELNLLEAKRKLQKWLNRTVVDYVPAEIGIGDRLHAHLFLPDLYMAPPPVCNVLFPDHYSQIQYGRNWMSEITRLLLHTRTQSGQDVKDLYFSPNTDILGASRNKKDLEEAIKKGISFLLPHEKYTGVLATTDVVSDVSIFKKIHEEVKKDLKEAVKVNPDPAVVEDAKASGEALFSPMEHLRRAANYLFFSKRFEGRSISITARFSPQVVVGLPMLVLTKTEGLQALREQPGEPAGGTHFLGLVAAVSHDIDAQGSAFTKIELTKCRDHREGLDIFGAGYDTITESKTVTVKKATVKLKQKETYTNAAFPVEGKNVVYANDPSEFSANVLPTTNKNNPSSPAPRSSALKELTVEEAAKEAGFKPKKGATYKVEVDFNPSKGDPQGPNTFNNQDFSIGLTVTETIRTRPETKVANIRYSFENTATPPWLASIYLPVNIGKMYYQQMLGCGSILDESPLSAPATASAPAGVPASAASEPNSFSNVVLQGTDRTLKVPNFLLAPANTVEAAADNLAETWERLRSQNVDMSAFVDTYTNRKYASFRDIMGYKNGSLSTLSGYQDTSTAPTDGRLGFHENAYGNLTDLKDVNGQEMNYEALPVLATPASGVAPAPVNTDGTIDAAVDPRAARYAVIGRYIRELGRSAGVARKNRTGG